MDETQRLVKEIKKMIDKLADEKREEALKQLRGFTYEKMNSQWGTEEVKLRDMYYYLKGLTYAMEE